MEHTVRQENEKLKVKRDELKVKQKTLGLYEYLIRLPPEQDQEVVKCNQCGKFFMSVPYLKRHYSRMHPDCDFYSDYDQ